MKKIPLFSTNDAALSRGEEPKIIWLGPKKYEKREAERPVKVSKENPFKKNFNYAKKYQKKEDELMNAADEYDVDFGDNGEDDRKWLDLPPGLSEEDLLDVYSKYPTKASFDHKLPINAYQSQIVDAIESSKVTLVEGGTGTGKSTQVAQFIYDHHFRHNKYCNVVVTQPRKIAAISLAHRVCSENGWDVGTVCGYQVGMDKMMGEDGRLMFCTTGVLLHLLIGVKHMNRFTHVILDEIHERSQEMDFCMLVVRKFLRTVSPFVKVVLMSATMEADKYLEYFKHKDFSGNISRPRHIHVSSGNFHVDEVYLDALKHLGNIPKEQHLNEPEVCDHLIDLALQLILSLDDPKIATNKNGRDGRGSVLVFLPGYEHIVAFQVKLANYADSHKLVTHVLHSLISASEQISVFSPVASGYRKLILSTNIAESSITVTDVKYVIDFCLTKTIFSDATTSHTSLQLQWTSKSSCTQRKGRAGRVANGTVFRMVSWNFYQQLPDFNTPEILRCSLQQLVLKAKLLDMGRPKAILALALTPPDLRKIKSTVFLLKEQGALNARSRDSSDGELTFMGQVMGGLPIDTRLSRFILFAHVFGMLDEAVIMAALMSIPSIFIFSQKFKLQSYMTKLKWANDTQSDSLASYQAYRAWEHLTNIGSFKTFKDQLHWCDNHFLDAKRLKEAKILVEELLKRLQTYDIRSTSQHEPINLKDPDMEMILKVLLGGGAYPNLFQYSFYDVREKSRQMCSYNHLHCVCLGGLPLGGGRYYKRDLLKTFNKLLPSSLSVKLHFINTKCFVEFPSEERNVHIGVNAAIKMRKLNEKLIVRFDDMTESRSYDRPNTSAPSTNEHENTGETHLPVLLTETGRKMIEITEIVDCATFYATFSSITPSKIALHTAIQQWISQNPSSLLESAKLGVHCLAEFHDGEGSAFYRAQIKQLKEDATATVFFIDYGNCTDVPVNQLRPLPSTFLFQPAQALRCELINVRGKNAGGLWSREDTSRFMKLINLNEEYMADIYSVVNGTLRIDLWKQQNSLPTRHVNKQLVQMGVAEWVEESSLSQKNNKERKILARKTNNNNNNNNNNNHNKNLVVRDEKVVIDINKNPGLRTLNLTGPHNPFEVEFATIGNLHYPRLVSIEQQSVNSVHIVEDPQEPSPPMVAMWISLNTSLSRLIVRDTTILPPIPGLMFFMALLYCPFAEYRLSDDKTRVIGALCGLGGYEGSLGKNEDDVESLFEAKDLELGVDVEVDEEDITMINDLRRSIDLIIGSRMNYILANLIGMQQGNRQLLSRLLNKDRGRIQTEAYKEPYKWGKLAADDCEDTHAYNNLLDTSNIFAPHKNIVLRRHDNNNTHAYHRRHDDHRGNQYNFNNYDDDHLSSAFDHFDSQLTQR